MVYLSSLIFDLDLRANRGKKRPVNEDTYHYGGDNGI